MTLTKIETTPQELKEATELSYKYGILYDIEFARAIEAELYPKCPHDASRDNHLRTIGCILRAGYILGQRAERARKK